jgi:hypothetical protein
MIVDLFQDRILDVITQAKRPMSDCAQAAMDHPTGAALPPEISQHPGRHTCSVKASARSFAFLFDQIKLLHPTLPRQRRPRPNR